MALKTGTYPIDATLYDVSDSGSYTTGGQSMGKCLTFHAVQFNTSMEVFWKPHSRNGATPAEVRILGDAATYEIILGDVNEDWLNMIFQRRVKAASPEVFDMSGGDNYKFGHLADANETYSLVLRPDSDPTKPYLWFPRAIVTSIGPVVWANQLNHSSPTSITILPLHDEDLDTAVFYGNVDQFPTASEGGLA